MMHPMRVEWPVPDWPKISSANEAISRDLRRMSDPFRLPDLEMLQMALSAATDAAGRDAVWRRRYPDLTATVTHYGTLLSVRYVPSHLGYEERDGSLPRMRSFAMPARWVALVATADGTVEMDPTKLRVMWSMSAGDPIGGIVEHDERARNQASQSKE